MRAVVAAVYPHLIERRKLLGSDELSEPTIHLTGDDLVDTYARAEHVMSVLAKNIAEANGKALRNEAIKLLGEMNLVKTTKG